MANNELKQKIIPIPNKQGYKHLKQYIELKFSR